MARVLGPILKFLGINPAGEWCVSALVVHDAGDPAPQAQADGGGLVAASQIHAWPASTPSHRVWRMDFALPMSGSARLVGIAINGQQTARCSVPARGADPKIAYASCNGFSDPKLMKGVHDKNALWSRLAKLHEAAPYQILMLGGDQVYTDSMWEVVPELKAWCALSMRERIASPFDAAMARAVEGFYFKLYLERWSQPEPARCLASIPSMMMWDDHDIFDGWGSYPAELQACPVYQGIFAAARRHFSVFQMFSADGSVPPATLPGQPGFSYAKQVGTTAMLALDMRSERSLDQVLSLTSWKAAYDWLDALDAQSVRHLLVMSSIPVVHPDFDTLEQFLGILPGQQELEDDLRDHWTCRAHGQERLRLIQRLLAFAASKLCRVTLLSGDVHVAAIGVIESDRDTAPMNARVINQLTSSGIVHPAPPGMVLYFLESVADKVEQVDRGITARMYEFPATRHRFIGARNFLSIEPDDKYRLWANWYVEGEDKPFTKVIHPVKGV